MILIADSGSTKTEWLLSEGGGEQKVFRTIGLNPYYISEADFREIVTVNLLRNFDTEDIKEVHFYGSGCGAESKSRMVRNSLSDLFTGSEVSVNTDILGAARALFGSSKGIACVLGTGANSCLYNGKEIKGLVSSPGFIFGDEGSGSNMGKTLLTHYFKGTMPESIKNAFVRKYNLIDSEILDAVYRKPFPNRFLATFSQFILENSTNKFIKKLIEDSFSQFIDNYVSRYKNYKKMPIGFIGSVAYFFRDILADVFESRGLKITTIQRTPTESLLRYHVK